MLFRSKVFVPTLDEIDAGLRGSFELVYELTPREGARWEKVVRPLDQGRVENSPGPLDVSLAPVGLGIHS